MNDFPALIRTYVPLALGVLFSWLASLGIEVDGGTKDLLTGGIGALLAAVYYFAVKKLERKFPWATVLLGSTQQPVAYAPSPDAVFAVVDKVALDAVAETYSAGKHAASDELAPLDDDLAPLDNEKG